MFTKTRWLAVVLVGMFVLAPHSIYAEKKKVPAKKPVRKKKKTESSLTLERLFPEKGLFGTSAGSTGFSVDGVKYLVKNYGVDPKRVGIHGWSFGGFQTQMCMYTKPDVFAVGIAGAGPTEWENYNSWYTTGTIGSSRVGVTDLKKYSLLPLAKNLKGKLLLLHGMEDSNVLYQDTVRVYRELLKAHKETLVELFLDPTGSHGLGGDVKTLARFRKYEEFLTRNLGEGKATGK